MNESMVDCGEKERKENPENRNARDDSKNPGKNRCVRERGKADDDDGSQSC